MNAIVSLVVLVAGLSLAQSASQKDAGWNLARASTKSTIGSSKALEYKYSDLVRNSITVYIIDTGITPTHTDFGRRARVGASFVPGESPVDQHGHGTHVAGTVGGSKYGICKTCQLVGVKVFGRQGNGGIQQIIQGIDWAVKDCKDGSKCVINMSLGGRGKAPQMDQAVQRATSKGIAVVVAAGNDYKSDSCLYTPTSAPTAYCVASSDINDRLSDFSNVGRCVKMIAPGSRIESAWIPKNPDQAYTNRTPVSDVNTIDGTSMASPQVAGIAAYLRSIGEGGRSAQSTYDQVTKYGLSNKIGGVPRGTKNLLSQNGYSDF